jgi:mlo protein
MAGEDEQKSLEQTPTWAVAAVCTVFVVASLVVERLIKYLGNVKRRSARTRIEFF